MWLLPFRKTWDLVISTCHVTTTYDDIGQSQVMWGCLKSNPNMGTSPDRDHTPCPQTHTHKYDQTCLLKTSYTGTPSPLDLLASWRLALDWNAFLFISSQGCHTPIKTNSLCFPHVLSFSPFLNGPRNEIFYSVNGLYHSCSHPFLPFIINATC